MTARGACDTVQSSIVSIVLRRAGEYGGDFKTEPNKTECGAGQPTYDFADVGQKRLGVRRLVQAHKIWLSFGERSLGHAGRVLVVGTKTRGGLKAQARWHAWLH